MSIHERGQDMQQHGREFEVPTSQNFMEMVEKKWSEGKYVCVGLDSELGKIPESIRRFGISTFNHEIIDATHDLVAAYKPNYAFYEAQGAKGIAALVETVRYIKQAHPDIPVILDAKRADIGNTNNGSVQFAFEECGADAITVNPYLGRKALEPFLEQGNKGIIVLARTSNEGAGEFQDLEQLDGRPLYQHVADHAVNEWNENGNIGLVMGATSPEELRQVREFFPDVLLLIPGVGAQGGDAEKVVNAARHRFLINSSRGVIFASGGADFANAAREATIQTQEHITAAMNSQ